ncbi:flavodoxin family protein [Amycolatopsis sp. NPDC059027]|uniref:flavodoxin family protein n=1 Tax=unclassified Amycolatopsis TaxID=2618356 RepID=UPI003670F25A
MGSTRAVVVFESMFGNTELVAEAVGAGLAPHVPVEVVNVDDAPSALDGIGLLVAGGPTHAHGMTRRRTREEAARQARSGTRSKRTGLREWLDTLEKAPAELATAVFDTRIAKPRWLTGSAAVGAWKRLRLLGCELLVPPESFFVDSSDPGTVLSEGENDRARAWGDGLGARYATLANGR